MNPAWVLARSFYHHQVLYDQNVLYHQQRLPCSLLSSPFSATDSSAWKRSSPTPNSQASRWPLARQRRKSALLTGSRRARITNGSCKGTKVSPPHISRHGTWRVLAVNS